MQSDAHSSISMGDGAAKMQDEHRKSRNTANVHALLVDLKSCSKSRNLEWGKRIHANVSECGSDSSTHVANALVNMYSKCGSMVDARRVFDSMRCPDVVSWTTLLSGYVENGEGLMCLDLFSSMKSQGCAPTAITYMAALRACASLGAKQDGRRRAEWLDRGKQIHREVGSHLDRYVQSTLIDMYAKCGSMVDAHQVFDTVSHLDVVSWNALLLGYADAGQGLVALDLFLRMKFENFAPTSITYVAALKACTSLAVKQDESGKAQCLLRGKEIHLEIGRHLNLYVQNTLIDMYGNCGSMVDAHQVFGGIKYPSVVSWTALLSGYAGNGKGRIALDLFSRMKYEGCTPNSMTYVAVLKACGLLGALESGREVHDEIKEFDVILVTCLVDFYAKCGSLVEAQKVFDLHSRTRNVATWTALLAGYSSFGDTDSVFRLFHEMQDAGIQPNGVTFQCLLMSCGHAGLVEKARECFEAISAKYGVVPSVEHCNCMIDVLGRANRLDDVVALLERMACGSDAVTWMTVLGACRKWRKVELGRLAFQCLLSLDETDAAGYVLMDHIYASMSMQEEQEEVLRMKSKYVKLLE